MTDENVDTNAVPVNTCPKCGSPIKANTRMFITWFCGTWGNPDGSQRGVASLACEYAAGLQQEREDLLAALQEIARAIPCQDYENVCNCQSYLIMVAESAIEDQQSTRKHV